MSCGWVIIVKTGGCSVWFNEYTNFHETENILQIFIKQATIYRYFNNISWEIPARYWAY